MTHTHKIFHLTFKNIFPHEQSPYAIYRHQVDGDHVNKIHDHEFIELVVISGGTGTQVTPYGEFPLQAGSLFVMQPGVWHEYIDCNSLLVNVCAMDCRVFDCELKWLYDNPSLRYLIWDSALTMVQPGVMHLLSSGQVLRAGHSFFTLQTIESKTTPPARVQQIGQLATFLAEIADCVAINAPMPHPERKLTGLTNAVEKTVMLFSENLARDWSIAELSASFGLTTPYYIRLFKREVGESPLSYLSMLRARRAAQLLMASDNSITSIALDIGWTEPGYFARRFRHYYGASPREYRQKYRDFTPE